MITTVRSRPGGALRTVLAAAACSALAPMATAQVQVFQHCNFGGWSATFTGPGSFNTSALTSRGGRNNDASSIRVAPGFVVTLFDGDQQTGASVTFSGNDSCFTNDNFNDRLSSLRIQRVG